MKLYLTAYIFLFTLSSIVASAQNNALNFDGLNDYVSVPYNASLDVSNTLTIEAWVYPTNNQWDNIVMKGNYGYGFALAGGSGGAGTCFTLKNLVFWDQSQCGSTIRSTLTYTFNTWQHVAVTVEAISSQLRIYFYLNGVQDGPYYSGVSTISNGGANSLLYIGTQGLGLGNYFAGSIDELRIWNMVRTSSQIQAAMNTELNPASQPNLVAYYNFNEGIADGNNAGVTTAIDATTNNNIGTLNNFALNGSTSNWVGDPIILPVRFLSFNAMRKNNSIELNWSTGQEQNSSSFEIQRSSDGSNFIPIGTIAAVGNSNYRIDYHFTDTSPLSSDNYYRLKQIDIDGKYIYSSVTEQTISSSTHLKLQGNPVQKQLKAVFFSTTNGNLQLMIADAAGSVHIKKTIAVRAGANEITIPLSGIKSGLYYLHTLCGDWKGVLKFLKV
jgi:hypothetical protein